MQNDGTRRLEHLVTRFARDTPDKIAVDGPVEELSYAQLDAMANRFARLFVQHGVKRGDRVGIHMPKSGRAVAAMLGAARAGAVFVPLDPRSPPARIALIASDCDLRHVVAAPALAASSTAASVQHFYLAGAASPSPAAPGAHVHAWSELEAQSAAPLPAPGGHSDELAYILYTSGSTGVPKGVMLSHENAFAFTEWAADEIALSPADRVASVAPFHFDLSVFDLWATLSRGATVVIVDEATVMSGRRMVDRIHEKAITVWYSVPSAFVLMLDDGELGRRGARSLRAVFFAGEVFPMKHLRRAMAAIPHARFHNLFGPTETNVCTAYALPGIPGEDESAIPIGFAASGDTCAILDGDRRPVADGEVGELFIEGPTVMLGYWNAGNPLPAPHPYPTGDLVSKRTDGALMYHGRRDHLVKVHGHRIELGEVEAAVQKHPKIREAVAVAVDQQLVVVAVPSDTSVTVLELKVHCAAHLPPYMVPGALRLVEDLPRTSSGKIDRKRAATATEGSWKLG